MMDNDEMNEWAVRMAEAAAPDEVELAPIMIQAYLKGGKNRQDLFREAQGDTAGGFGAADFQAVFPWIINGIGVAAPLIHAAIISGGVDKYLSLIIDLFSIRDSLARKKKVETLPDDPYSPLKRVITTLSKELAVLKISQDKRDLITYHVVLELLKDKNSVKFVQKLSEASK